MFCFSDAPNIGILSGLDPISPLSLPWDQETQVVNSRGAKESFRKKGETHSVSTHTSTDASRRRKTRGVPGQSKNDLTSVQDGSSLRLVVAYLEVHILQSTPVGGASPTPAGRLNAPWETLVGGTGPTPIRSFLSQTRRFTVWLPPTSTPAAIRTISTSHL